MRCCCCLWSAWEEDTLLHVDSGQERWQIQEQCSGVGETGRPECAVGAEAGRGQMGVSAVVPTSAPCAFIFTLIVWLVDGHVFAHGGQRALKLSFYPEGCRAWRHLQA